MKGLIAIIFVLLSLGAQASVGIEASSLKAIKLESGELIGNLSVSESANILKSLDSEASIELRSRVIYPEEVSKLIVSKLTKGRLIGRSPNPQDYN